MGEARQLDIAARLALLRNTGVLDDALSRAAAEAAATIARRLGRSLESDTGHMLVTHVAMALKRARDGEALREPAEELRAELATRDEELRVAREVVDALERQARVQLPDGEVFLIAAYVGALKEEGGS